MNSVSDVLAFAAEHPDYWTDLLSDTDYPKELSDQDRAGLVAAREHIDNAAVILLQLCAKLFFEALGAERARKKTFQGGAAAKNRRIDLNPPKDTDAKLYRLEFKLWGDAASAQPVCLWAGAVAKKKYLQRIEQELAKASVEYTPIDYYIWASGVPLTRDHTFADLANVASTRMISLVKAVYSATLQ